MDKKKLRLNYFSEKFQLRYGIWVATIGVFCFLIMGFLAYLSVYRAIEALIPANLAHDIADKVGSPRVLFLKPELLIPLSILSFFLFAIGIIGTHKIAGPLFALKRHMIRVRNRQQHGEINLRKSDELHDLAGALSALINDFEDREKFLQKKIAALEGELSKHNDKKAA